MKKIFQKISIRIALIILIGGPAILITTTILLNIILSLTQPYNTIATHEQNSSIPSNEVLVQLKSNPSKEILIPVNKLNTRALWVLEYAPLIAISTSLILGIIAARFITKPLNKLNSGILSLRENNYKYQMNKTGTPEIDKVIEEFNKLSNKLKNEEILRKNLISDTSHEFKTPISALLGQLKAIKEGILILDNERIDLLYSQVERLNKLVDRLQEYSSARINTINIQREDINLFKLVEEIYSLYQEPLNTKHIKIINKIPSDYILLTDKKIFSQILVNLLDNAIKYSEASEIYIKIFKNIFVFEDNGVGIEEEKLPYIFERFYRGDPSRNTETGGIGLGLAIVKELVESLGWKIIAHNHIPPKSGLSFKIYTK